MERNMRDFDKIRENYEFQLEGRQMKIIVLGASAVCLLVFVLGFLIGRHFPRNVLMGDSVPAISKQQYGAVQKSQGEEASSGFTFEFFEELSEKDLEAEPQKEEPSPQTAAVQEAETRPPESVPRPEPVPQEDPSVDADPLPAEVSEAADAEVVKTPTLIATLYTIQVGAFEGPDGAETLSSQLKRKGYLSYTQIKDVPSKGIWYRVRVGQYKARSEAETVSRLLEEREGLTTFITLYSR